MQPKLPLNNLNTFVCAAEFGSFQLAAEQLHVTPSAVSHQIRNLEQLLGYPLFERLDKRVRLSARGERLFAELRGAFRDIHRASERARLGTDPNCLRLSVAPAFATRWLLPRLEQFYAAQPQINLALTVSTELVDFSRDEVDAVIRLGRGGWPGTETHKLFDMALAAVCRPALIERHGGLFSPAELLQQPLVHNRSLNAGWEGWMAAAGVSDPLPSNGLSVQNSAQALEVLQSGEWIALIDRPLVADQLANGSLTLASDHSYSAGLAYYLASARDSWNHPPLQAFRQWLIASLNSEP